MPPAIAVVMVILTAIVTVSVILTVNMIVIEAVKMMLLCSCTSSSCTSESVIIRYVLPSVYIDPAQC